jgi:hypothetical protein
MKHIITYRAGAPGYVADHQRGTVDVWHDQKRYIYRRATARAARAFIAHAWQQEYITITGRYPSYTVENTQ